MGDVAGTVKVYRRLVAELFTVGLTQSASDVVRAQASMIEFVDGHFELRRQGLYINRVVADAREQIIQNLAPELGDEKARFFADAPVELLRRALREVMDDLAEEQRAVEDGRSGRLIVQASECYLSG